MSNRKIRFLFLIVLCSSFPAAIFAQIHTYEFEQIDSLQRVAPRPVFVFIHTKWCKFCAAMEQTSFKDKLNIETLNDKYYCVFFDAETKRDILFSNHLFKFKATGNNTGSHQLAEQLAFNDGQIAYPTICVLNPKKEIIFQHSSYLLTRELRQILVRLSK